MNYVIKLGIERLQSSSF